MSSFDWKKISEDSIKDELIITANTTGYFNTSMNATDIMKLADGIVRGILVKDYSVYKKSIDE